MKDFKLGAADYRVPQKWELGLQNSLLESLLSQGYNAFLVFPGDPVGSNSTVQELTENGAPVIATAGCLKEPTTAVFCFGTDTGNSAYLGTKELIKAMGGKGRIAHFTGFLVDPNTQLRIDAVEKAAKETNGAVTVVQVIADIDAPGRRKRRSTPISPRTRATSTASSRPPGCPRWSPPTRCARSATSASRWSASTTTKWC